MAEFTAPSTYAKGLTFELRLAQLFEANGYKVEHNVKRTGKSGVEHQIDLLLTFAGPLHKSKIVVEAKAYEASVDKERIIKLVHVVNDIGADRGIIVTTSQFTASAEMTAEGANVELWGHERLAPLLRDLDSSVSDPKAPEIVEYVIEPQRARPALVREIEGLLERRSKGFFGVGRVEEKLRSLSLVHLPLFQIRLGTWISERQRVGLFKEETIQRSSSAYALVDALYGTVLDYGPEGLSFAHDWMIGLGDDELSLLTSTRGRFISPASLALLEISQARSKRALNSLIAKGILQRTVGRPAGYVAQGALPSLSDNPQPLLKSLPGDISVTHERRSGTYIKAVISPARITRLAELLWGDHPVQELVRIYYPFFYVTYERPGGSIRVEVRDGIQSVPNPAALSRLTNGVLEPATTEMRSIAPVREEADRPSSSTQKPAPSGALVRFQSVLELELRRGCDDGSVVGGIDRYLASARADHQIAAFLDISPKIPVGYRALSVEERSSWLRGVLKATAARGKV